MRKVPDFNKLMKVLAAGWVGMTIVVKERDI